MIEILLGLRTYEYDTAFVSSSLIATSPSRANFRCQTGSLEREVSKFRSTMDGNSSPVVTLVRHGETDWNVAGRIQGQLDKSRLTDKGKQQALVLASSLSRWHPPFRRVCCSPLTRAVDTLRVLQSAGAVTDDNSVDLSYTPDLSEICFEWQGCTRLEASHRADYIQFKASPETYSGEGGVNPIHELRGRVCRVLRSMEAVYDDEVPELIVAHRQFNQEFILQVLRAKAGHGTVSQGNCAWSVFRRTSGGLVLESSNELHDGSISRTIANIPSPEGALIVFLAIAQSQQLLASVLQGIRSRAAHFDVVHGADATSKDLVQFNSPSFNLSQKHELQTACDALSHIRKLCAGSQGAPVLCIGETEFLSDVLSGLIGSVNLASRVKADTVSVLGMDSRGDRWCLELLNAT
jgi:glucosyl-3-phosphoglycerate phosphatase